MERSAYSRTALAEMKAQGTPYQTKTTGMLNPAWCESLMNYPQGWTELDDPPAGLPAPAKRNTSGKLHELQKACAIGSHGSRRLGNAVCPGKCILPIAEAIWTALAAEDNAAATGGR
jgi:hypothetical protein